MLPGPFSFNQCLLCCTSLHRSCSTVQAMETISAGPFICREKVIRRAAWEACNLEMFKSLHPNGKWKEGQVCAKRKVVITVCFPSFWAKNATNQAGFRTVSCTQQLILPRYVTQTLPHKSPAAALDSATRIFICPELCSQI